MSKLRRHWGILLLLLIYVMLAVLFSVNIPLSKAPDEYVHFTYIRFLIDHGRPPITLAEQQGAGYKSDQPPLYHSLVALVTAPIDVSEPPSFKFSWEPASRQLIDIVLPRTLLIHTADELWPYRGLFLAWFVGRWLSVVLSSLTLILTYLIALEIFPGKTWLALVSAALLAFIPRFIIIGSVLSDDNMVGLVMALFLLAVVKLFNGSTRPALLFAVCGGLVGLALSTKYSALPVPLEMFILSLWLARREGWPLKTFIIRLAVFALTLAVVASFWFSFLMWHFNQIEEFGLIQGVLRPIMAGGNNEQETGAILDVVTGSGLLDVAGAEFAEGNVLDWWRFLFTQFWDFPIVGVSQPYPPGVVLAAALLLCGLAAVGWVQRWRKNQARQRMWLGVLGLHLLTFIPIPFIRFISIKEIHDTAQARHLLFPAAPAIAILLAAGLVAVFPARWRKVSAAAAIGLTLLVTLAHLYYYVTGFPAPLPVRTDPTLAATPAHPISADFADGLTLRGLDWRINSNHALDVDLYWRVAAPPTVDYRTELTLRDSTGAPQRRWLSHPANGRFPTRAWDAGDSVRDTVNVPLVGLPAGPYQVELRLLDWDGNPLPTTAGNAALLFKFSLPETLPAQPPTLWQQGRPVTHPCYRYRETIPLTGAGGNEASLVGPAGETYLPEIDENGLALFLVDHTWPSGIYQVQVDGADSGLRLAVENLDWTLAAPEITHSLNANFNDEIMLLGYDLPLRRADAGDGVPLVLYWQGLRQMSNSYIIFDRLLDATQQAWGGYDRLPKETYPTDLWVPGEVVVDGFAVPVDPAAPPGVYDVVIGLYDEADSQAQSLPIYREGQPTGQTSIRIGPIKVGGPPPEVTLSKDDLAPANPLTVEFGDPPVIMLRGFDLSETDETVRVQLYWQSLAQTPTNWTRFLHLRNESGETVAQVDAPPAGGQYPTSLWDANEISFDEAAVPVAELPSGQYSIYVGLYNLFDGTRLSVAGNPVGELELTKVTIP